MLDPGGLSFQHPRNYERLSYSQQVQISDPSQLLTPPRLCTLLIIHKLFQDLEGYDFSLTKRSQSLFIIHQVISTYNEKCDKEKKSVLPVCETHYDLYLKKMKLRKADFSNHARLFGSKLFYLSSFYNKKQNGPESICIK
jgi:hypothetical protein